MEADVTWKLIRKKHSPIRIKGILMATVCTNEPVPTPCLSAPERAVFYPLKVKINKISRLL